MLIYACCQICPGHLLDDSGSSNKYKRRRSTNRTSATRERPSVQWYTNGKSIISSYTLNGILVEYVAAPREMTGVILRDAPEAPEKVCGCRDGYASLVVQAGGSQLRWMSRVGVRKVRVVDAHRNRR